MGKLIISLSANKTDNEKTLLRMMSAEVSSLALTAEGKGNQHLTQDERERHASEYKRIMLFPHSARHEVQEVIEAKIGMTYWELQEICHTKGMNGET